MNDASESHTLEKFSVPLSVNNVLTGVYQINVGSFDQFPLQKQIGR